MLPNLAPLTGWCTPLFGIAFFSHQGGGFLGVWRGGVVFTRTGSHDPVWWLGVRFAVPSAIADCREARGAA